MAAVAKRIARGTSATGVWGERVAAAWLEDRGYSIVGRRVRPALHDEIDIIARKGRVLAFVEVKARSSEVYGRPASAVDRRKRKALCRAAAAYLRGVRYPDMAYRFDIVEVVGSPASGSPPVVRLVEDAFRFPLRYRFARKGPPASAGFTGRILDWFRCGLSRLRASARQQG